jgi:hypothetical protein
MMMQEDPTMVRLAEVVHRMTTTAKEVKEATMTVAEVEVDATMIRGSMGTSSILLRPRQLPNTINNNRTTAIITTITATVAVVEGVEADTMRELAAVAIMGGGKIESYNKFW